MKRNDPLVGSFLSYRIEQFHETRLVGVTHWRFAIRLDPFGMLNPQVVMDLLAEFGVRVSLVGDARGSTWRFQCSARRFV